MGQRACKILFTLFALILLFLSCDHYSVNHLDSSESFETASQSETVLKCSEQVLIWVIPEKTLLKIECNEEKPILKSENLLSVCLISLIYPVGILAPPSFSF